MATKKSVPNKGKQTVQVGKQTVTLGIPDVPEVYDVITSMGSSESTQRRASLAALGLCWERGPTLHAPASYVKCKYDPLRYGGEVERELTKRGVSWSAILTAAQTAFLFLAEHMPASQDDVDAAEGFSEDHEDTSGS